MVYFCIMMFNTRPNTKGISDCFPSCEIATGRQLDFRRYLKVQFGVYIKPHIDADITNNTKGSTHPCMSLGSTGNLHGSAKCFDLTTGKVVALLPMNFSIRSAFPPAAPSIVEVNLDIIILLPR